MSEKHVQLTGEAWAVVPKEQLTDEAMHGIVTGLRERFPGKQFVVFAEPVDLVPLTSLDTAWKAAEAACERRGLVLEELTRYPYNRYYAAAWDVKGDVPHTTGEGDTPTAALLKLAERLAG